MFIRAPWVETWGPRVQPIAWCDGHVVGVRQDHLLGLAFHPELTGDSRLHGWFLKTVSERCCAEPVAATA